MRTFNIKSFLMLLAVMFILASCGLKSQAEIAADKLEITYAPGESSAMVKSNFSLSEKIDEATVTWVSSDNSIVSIQNYEAILTRRDASQDVTLTATVTKGKTRATKVFEMTIFRKPLSSELFTITWIIEGEVKTTVGELGVMPKITAPRVDGLTFRGWSPNLVLADKDATYQAIFVATKSGKLPDNMLNLNQWQLSLPTKHAGVPSIGKFDLLVIPVEIKNSLFPVNYMNRLDLLFNGTEAETGWQSVATYYYLSSYGKLDLSFDIAPKVTMSSNSAFYQNKGDLADEYAIIEAVAAVNPTIDFSQYDFNDDGIIDGVIFVYSVDYSTTLDSWWAWVYDASYFGKHKTPTLDGLKLGYYMWISYSFADDYLPNANLNAATYIHEMGHMLGQTDLYSKDDYNSGPLGDWDMMDYNSGDHGPFSKLLWGWIEPTVLYDIAKHTITIDSYATDTDGIDSVILIPRSNANFSDRDVFDEYLLIIFYTPEGLYSAHKDTAYGVNQAGVVIYQIDARLSSKPDFWNFFLNDNSGDGNYLAQILEADKNNSIPTYGYYGINHTDFLKQGTLALDYYKWNQGGNINVYVTVSSQITNNSSGVSLVIDIY